MREKEHRLSESQRIAHIGSWTLDPNDPIGRLIWSDEMYRMYGVSRTHSLPRSWSCSSGSSLKTGLPYRNGWRLVRLERNPAMWSFA